MKVPLSWLKEYVDVDADAVEIAERLTFSGIEVEGIRQIGGGYEGVVVGEVVSFKQHPQADRLRLCRVNNGAEEVSIVCGAANFNVGDKVPLIGVGGRLPNGMKIKKAKIRGEVSHGMMCSERELGLSDNHDGIMILPENLPVGMPFESFAGPPEIVLDLEVTWNRPDCLSIIGIAREIAALFGTDLKIPQIEYKESEAKAGDLVKVNIDDPSKCPRYIARVISDINMGESPSWMQKRLNLCGMRPVNNVVDVTNYVMLECGQPLHAFDMTRVHGSEIVVRNARQGEKLETLDGQERELTPDILMITDPKGALAVAGVMGGAGSEISDATNTVLLESAGFAPSAIRNASSLLGLSSESSYRFERGVDPIGAEWASRRACALFAACAGGTVASGSVDAFPGKAEKRSITFRFDRARSLLGLDIPNEEMVSIFESLMIPVSSKDEKSCVVDVPGFRMDLEIEADLIEEVARMRGLDSLPSPVASSMIVPDADELPAEATAKCRRNLIGLGLSESVNYSFMSRRLIDTVGGSEGIKLVEIPNPVSSDHAFLRHSLIPQMVETLGRNLARQIPDAGFFEIGKGFSADGETGVRETELVCLGLMGDAGFCGTEKLDDGAMFLRMKGLIECLCIAQGVEGLQFSVAERPGLKKGYTAEIRLGDAVLGIMGCISPDVKKNWRMTGPVSVSELDMSQLTVNHAVLPKLKKISAYPSVSRDIAMVVAESVTHGDIMKVIHSSAPVELTDVKLFDIFRSEDIGAGMKSVAYSLVYQAMDRTLTDETANGFHHVIKDALKRKLGAEIREN